jgi:hypothetical protein
MDAIWKQPGAKTDHDRKRNAGDQLEPGFSMNRG